MLNQKRNAWLTLIAILLLGPLGNASQTIPSQPVPELEKIVRHKLATLPYFTVFDHFDFSLDGSKVVLKGQVTQPTQKSAAERVAMLVAGVTNVVNEIEVLPLSFNDDRIRWATYRALYGSAPLFKYGIGANRSIRIIVQNGNVTLEGFVSREMDKNVATLMAKGVSGVFSVTNHLRIG